jgi:hypothetical protein
MAGSEPATRTHNKSTLVFWRVYQFDHLKGYKIYAHKNEVLGGLEGVRHTYKAGKAIEGRKRESTSTKSVGCMRICMNDGF